MCKWTDLGSVIQMLATLLLLVAVTIRRRRPPSMLRCVNVCGVLDQVGRPIWAGLAVGLTLECDAKTGVGAGAGADAGADADIRARRLPRNLAPAEPARPGCRCGRSLAKAGPPNRPRLLPPPAPVPSLPTVQRLTVNRLDDRTLEEPKCSPRS